MMGRFTALTAVFFCLFALLLQGVPAQADQPEPGSREGIDSSLKGLKDELMSYFVPVTGKIISVQGNSVKIDAGSRKSIRSGMRLSVFKEGFNFVHPVTKEPMGKVEMPVGNIEITLAGPDSSDGVITNGKPEDFMNANVKVPGTKIKLLFCQGNVDWFLGESYYQMLKETGRFMLIDTGVEGNDSEKIISEARAKGADAALVLSGEESGDSVPLAQKLYWVKDSKQFSHKEVSIDVSRIRELRFKAGLFGPKEGEALLSYKLPYGGTLMSVGDFDADGNPEIVVVTGNTLKGYRPGTDLKALWEFKVPATSDVLWIDSLAVNRDGRDQLLITSMRNAGKYEVDELNMQTKPAKDNEVASYIYEVRDEKPVQLLKIDGMFIRKLGKEIIAQEYGKGEGYRGKVFRISYSGGAYKKGEDLKLPPGTNIYDFQYAVSPDGAQGVLAWDEAGRLNLYNDKGIRLWVSKEDFGGFAKGFKKESPTIMVGKGKWTIKDRLFARSSEILVPKRKPLLGIAKGLGYASSEIKSLWWNGISVDDRVFIDGIGGEVLDYCPVGDRILVLVKTGLVAKVSNIFKGMSPMGVNLYIFSAKGR